MITFFRQTFALLALTIAVQLKAAGTDGVPVQLWVKTTTGSTLQFEYTYYESPAYLGPWFITGGTAYYYHHSKLSGANLVHVYGYDSGSMVTVNGYLSVSGTFLPSSPTASDAAVTATMTGTSSGQQLSLGIGHNGVVRVEPGKSYTVAITATNTIGGSLNIMAPPQYRVVIEGMARNSTPIAANVTFTVVPRYTAPPGAAGFASSVGGTRLEWRMALGRLHNGDDAGSLCISESANGANWDALYTPAVLNCETTSDEIVVSRTSGVINSIGANQMTVNVVTLSNTSYEIQCRRPGATGDPFTVYRVEKGATATSLKFTKETRNITSLTATNVPVARREIMTIQRSGTWPNYTWSSTDWTLENNTAVVTTAGSSSGTLDQNGQVPTRSESVTLSGASTAMSLARSFELKSFGEAMVSETLGTTQSLQTTFNYYTTLTQPGSLGYVSSVGLPGGGWEAYEYFDAGQAHSYSAGKLKRKFRPFGSSPSTVSTDPALGEVTEYTFSADPFGFNSRLAVVETKVNNVVTATSRLYYDSTAANGLITMLRDDYSADAAALRTTTQYYSEGTNDTMLRGKPYSVQQPSGVKQSYAYQWGSWNGTTFTPQISPVFGSTRIAVITGSAQSVAGTACTSWGGFNLSTVYLVDGKSTLEVAIRDERALVVRTESHVWKSNAWQLVGFVDYTYNHAGLLTQKVANNGATWTAIYDGQLKTSETAESGVTISYAYDVNGRVLTTTRAAQSPIGALVTRFTYDGASHVTQEQVGWAASGNPEMLVTSRTYDDAGRLTSEAPPGNYGSSTHSYNVGDRTHTVTRADGSTIIETKHIDGRVLSKTGTAVVHEHHTYGRDNGKNWHRVDKASSSSARWEKTWTDWMGRPLETERPGFTGQQTFVETNVYAATTGLRTKTTKTGHAATFYQYGYLGEVTRSGLDYDQSDSLVLASTDRITDTSTALESLGGHWWMRTDTFTYPHAGIATAVRQSTSRKRLTGFGTNQFSETQAVDAEGNTMTESVVINRTSKTATKTTTKTGIANASVENSLNGFVTSVTDHAGLTASTTYDALHRPATVTDSRSNTTTSGYVTGTALVSTVTDAASHAIVKAYDALGRVSSTRDQKNHYTRFSYTSRGELARQWGDGAVPVEYCYDNFGAKTAMRTFRVTSYSFTGTTWPLPGGDTLTDAAGTPPTTGDRTRWVYDGPSGLLTSKIDAAGAAVTYTYNLRGQTHTRAWARGVVTTYGYDGASGELLTQTYSDTTPAVTFVYNRSGQVEKVTDVTGERRFAYDLEKPWRLNAEQFGSYYGNRAITRLYDETAMPGRIRGFGVGPHQGNNADLEQTFGYAVASGRFETLTTNRFSTTTPTRTFRYAYLTNSHLIQSLSIDGSHPFTITRAFESTRDMLTSIEAKWSTTSRTKHAYVSDERGQRTSVVQSGDVFADYGDSTFRLFTYNGRGELTLDAGFMGSNVSDQTKPMHGRRHGYAYDDIGNRKWSDRTGVDTTPADGLPDLRDDYTTDATNRYATKENHTIPLSGTAAVDAGGAGGTAVVVHGRTIPAGRQGKYWNDEITVNNVSAPWRGPVSIYTAKRGATDVARIDSRTVEIGQTVQTLSYDTDGNITGDGIVNYTWDAENRLIKVETITPTPATFSRRKVEFRYDYQHRRVQKQVLEENASSQLVEISCRRYLYDGWNLTAEYAAPGGSSIGMLLKSYTWGLDIGGSLTEAGGVGALLQIADLASNKTHLPGYDGNGNVVGLFDADASSSATACVAAYEYSPYGEFLRCEGTYAKENPFRFSTKVADDETGLVYYGERYYSPSHGRFINRDPIEEEGGMNIYGFCGNNPINGWDFLGLAWVLPMPTGFHIPAYGGPVWVPTEQALANGDFSDIPGLNGAKSFYGNALSARGIVGTDGRLQRIEFSLAIDGIISTQSFRAIIGSSGELRSIDLSDSAGVGLPTEFFRLITTNNATLSVLGSNIPPGVMRDIMSGSSGAMGLSQYRELAEDLGWSGFTSFLSEDQQLYYGGLATQILVRQGVGESVGNFWNQILSEMPGVITDANGMAMSQAASTARDAFSFSMNSLVVAGAAVTAGAIITGYTWHGLNQAIARDGVGVSTRAILDAVKNPVKVTPSRGNTTVYVGKDATVVLNSQGKVITTHANNRRGVRAPLSNRP